MGLSFLINYVFSSSMATAGVVNNATLYVNSAIEFHEERLTVFFVSL